MRKICARAFNRNSPLLSIMFVLAASMTNLDIPICVNSFTISSSTRPLNTISRSTGRSFAAGVTARFRQEGKNSSQWDLRASGSDEEKIDEAFREFEQMLETKYIRYCDPSQSLHLMT